MADILHEVGVKASPLKIYRHLTDPKLISKWWTKTTGSAEKGGELQFWFGKDFCFRMTVIDLKKGKKVIWRNHKGSGEWSNTKIQFKLKREGSQTLIHFSHTGWKKQSETFRHCNTKWAVFMVSLKELMDKGRGKPYPRDIQVNHYK
jgi:uncharacterized protein YndB with AHSA1/START domain